jgi:hypothetical protein
VPSVKANVGASRISAQYVRAHAREGFAEMACDGPIGARHLAILACISAQYARGGDTGADRAGAGPRRRSRALDAGIQSLEKTAASPAFLRSTYTRTRARLIHPLLICRAAHTCTMNRNPNIEYPEAIDERVSIARRSGANGRRVSATLTRCTVAVSALKEAELH